MKILVPVKRVADHHHAMRVRPDGTGLENDAARYEMNPFDAIALETALRLREAGGCREIVVVSCGARTVHDVLRHALALGADRAVWIDTDAALQPLGVARLIKALALRESPDLILMGKQAVDDDAAQTGPMLAAMLGWPQACCASALECSSNELHVTCEQDDGLLQLALGLPAVVTADLRLAVPRFASLANVMQARRRPIEEITASGLDVMFAARLQTERFATPLVRGQGIRLESSEALAQRLREFLPMERMS